MNTLHVCIVTSTLLVLGPSFGLHGLSAACAETARDRVLTGELVATNAGRNQFRIVGHGGSFTAPAGASVEALDGKPVQVELAHNGRVLQVTEEPSHINRIEHSEELISGQFVVRDPVARTFSFASDDHIYIAPSGIDIRRYGGHMVEVRLDEDGQVAEIGFATHALTAPGSTCVFNGQSYSDSAAVCQDGMQYRCEAGTWRDLDTICGSNGTTVFPSPRSCMVGAASVADGSSICRSGTTFRCTDGTWVNVGTACS